MKWLLCDYGEVLSLPPSRHDREALEAEAATDGPAFWAAYWQYRPAYDRGGLDTAHYWAQVFGRAPGVARIRRLHDIDTAMWSHPNQPTIDAANRAAQRGLKLAVLSNAPSELADSFDRLPWLDPFAPRLFSGRLGAVKPAPAVYLAALDALHAQPADVTFIDDRPVNVEAAQRLGLRAVLFTHSKQLDAITAERSDFEGHQSRPGGMVSPGGSEAPSHRGCR